MVQKSHFNGKQVILVYFFPLEVRMWTVTGIALLMFLSAYFMLVFKKLLLQDVCFTILCWLLPHININQSQVYICPLSLEPPSHLPSHPTPLSCHRAPA